jgi:hypothetical protein
VLCPPSKWSRRRFHKDRVLIGSRHDATFYNSLANEARLDLSVCGRWYSGTISSISPEQCAGIGTHVAPAELFTDSLDTVTSNDTCGMPV